MRVSTRGRYGLRAMFELACGFGEGPMLMSAVARRQNLSRKHLHNLLTALKSAGLVQSVLGPGGGFMLSRPPSRIRLGEILRALEGPLSLVDCVENDRACPKTGSCAARSVWVEVSAAIEETLDRVTLEDMMNRPDGTCRPAKARTARRVSLPQRPGAERGDVSPRVARGPGGRRSGRPQGAKEAWTSRRFRSG